MKKIVIFMTVLSITIMLLAGCTASESAQTPDQEAPVITAPAPSQETPSNTTAPDQTTPSTTPASEPTTLPPNQSPATGTLTVFVTDAPSYVVDNVTVHFSKVEVHKASDGDGGTAGWIEVELDDGAAEESNGYLTINDTKQVTLSEDMDYVRLAQGQVPAGKYTQIRVYMQSEEIEGEEIGAWVSYFPDPADTETTKRIPAILASETLKFVRPFEVLPAVDDGEGEGAGTDIELDFDLQKSVVFTGATQSEDPKVIVKPVVKLAVTMGEGHGECELDGELLRLENKNPDTWEIIEEEEPDPEVYGELKYNTEGDVFCYDFEAFGLGQLDSELADANWSLIYYADFYEDDPEDRYNTWGGNYPGALIASGNAEGGHLKLEGWVNLREDLDPVGAGIDLPHSDDGNRADYNYTDSDGYEHAHGAKIWLVPSDCYDPDNFRIYETKWEPTHFLFETDLITFNDTDNEYDPLPE